MESLRSLRALACAAAAIGGTAVATPPAAAAPKAGASASLSSRLGSALRPAGRGSGAYVVNATTGRRVFGSRQHTARVLASNTKLFTTTAALARYGVHAKLATEVRGTGTLAENGTYRGSLYLVGGGDPTFGSSAFGRRAYGGGASVQTLAKRLKAIGIRKVTGRIYGDESKFDALRGGPDSRYGVSPYVGPLSALSYNRGLATESGRGYQASPPAFAAARLDAALAAVGVGVSGAPRSARAPSGATPLAKVKSPAMSSLVRLTNKPSDNFFAEMLSKDLALIGNGRGTTRDGARLAAGFARRLGAAPASLTDGSGLSRGNRASPYRVTRLLLAMRTRDEFPAFFDSLSIAGRDGTLAGRMRGGAARGRCRGKTGTLTGVTALSGYCTAASGDVYAFSILMNGVNTTGGRAIQDRMAQLIASSG
ncbi:MAG: D-alanyl-D-alanine carboxypeptidase/D-alanyl-D-alanine endopeptidase [Thermoleophilaceae bacterium]